MLLKLLYNLHYDTFGPGKGVVDHLRETACNVHGLNLDMYPEGWFYWPMSAGGLSLENPVVQHLPIRAARITHDNEVLEDFKNSFKHYKDKKAVLEEGEKEIENNPSMKDNDREKRRAELKKIRNDMFTPAQTTFENMMRHVCQPEAPRSTQQFSEWKTAFLNRLRAVFKDQHELRNYWTWLITNYGGDIERIFGTFNFFKAEHASSVMINMIRKSGST
eukprot:GHVP01050018.1.p1 GENE.GHVP01050018.1~~GHVP01050018.1.p1  ORF type:complete len:219 (+),score=40.66 GHVP01050018.1:453-1109(+)